MSSRARVRRRRASLTFATVAHAQTDRYDALANSPMAENRPTPETSKLLKDELLFQRATQTYFWALPLINTLGMKVGSERRSGPARVVTYDAALIVTRGALTVNRRA